MCPRSLCVQRRDEPRAVRQRGLEAWPVEEKGAALRGLHLLPRRCPTTTSPPGANMSWKKEILFAGKRSPNVARWPK